MTANNRPEWASPALSDADTIAFLETQNRSLRVRNDALTDALFNRWSQQEADGTHPHRSQSLLRKFFLRKTASGGLNQGECIAADGDAITLQLFSWGDGGPTNMEAASATEVLIDAAYQWYATRFDFLTAIYFQHTRIDYADTCGTLADHLRGHGFRQTRSGWKESA